MLTGTGSKEKMSVQGDCASSEKVSTNLLSYEENENKIWNFEHLLKIQQEQLNALHWAQRRLDQLVDQKGKHSETMQHRKG